MLMHNSMHTSNEMANELSSKSLLANVLDINDDWIGINKKKEQEQQQIAQSPQQHIKQKKSNNSKLNNGSLMRDNSSVSQSGTDNSEPINGYMSNKDMLRKCLTAILKELRSITQKLKEDEDDEGKALDWKFAAMVIDRLCMVVFTVATLLSTVLILFTSKNIFKPSDPSHFY